MVAGSSEAAQKAVRVRRGGAGMKEAGAGASPLKWALAPGLGGRCSEVGKISSNPCLHGAINVKCQVTLGGQAAGRQCNRVH